MEPLERIAHINSDIAEAELTIRKAQDHITDALIKKEAAKAQIAYTEELIGKAIDQEKKIRKQMKAVEQKQTLSMTMALISMVAMVILAVLSTLMKNRR